MTHRVTKIELKPSRGNMHVRAMGRTGRGTKFLIREIVVPVGNRPRAEVRADYDRAITELMVGKD